MVNDNFALTSLSDNPEYFEEVIHLIEEEFHYNKDHHYEVDFAPLMNPLNFENCYLFIDDKTNTVAAHLAVCERLIVKDQSTLKVAFIGGIVTHKNYRHQQLFRKLMEHALEKHSSCGLFILWSDLENIYEKFAFHRTGGLVETGKRSFSASERPSGYEKNKFSTLSEKDFQRIVSIYSSSIEKKFFTVKRENKDWSIIRELESIDLYVKRNLSGEIIRYFCVNKGHDLNNVIHEIGAVDSNELDRLINDLESYKLWLPEIQSNRFKNSDIYYTAFFRLGQAEVLNDFFSKVTSKSLIILSIDQENVSFKFKEASYKASQKDFLQFVFGPKPLEELAPFELSLYVAGADSV